MPKVDGKYYVSKSRDVRLRKLSPSEFQIFLAIKTLGSPTVRELQEFLAALPPLSSVLEKHPESVLDQVREAPTYNNVNTTLLRMQEAGAVSFLLPVAGGERRLGTVWPLAETIAHCVHVGLRDFLAYRPWHPKILSAILEEIVTRYSDEEKPALEEELHAEITAMVLRLTGRGLPKTHPLTLDRKALKRSLKPRQLAPKAKPADRPKKRLATAAKTRSGVGSLVRKRRTKAAPAPVARQVAAEEPQIPTTPVSPEGETA